MFLLLNEKFASSVVENSDNLIQSERTGQVASESADKAVIKYLKLCVSEGLERLGHTDYIENGITRAQFKAKFPLTPSKNIIFFSKWSKYRL